MITLLQNRCGFVSWRLAPSQIKRKAGTTSELVMKCTIIGTLVPGAHMLVQTWSVALIALAVLVPVAVGMLFLRERFWWRVGLLIVAVSAIGMLDAWWLAVKQPQIASALAVKQFTASNEVASEVRAFHAATQALQEAIALS